jgi:hypothetical protein
MRISDEQAKKLLEFTGRPQITQLALSMALTQFKKRYKSEPSPAIVARCAAELNAILEKFAPLMKADYDWITKL